MYSDYIIDISETPPNFVKLNSTINYAICLSASLTDSYIRGSYSFSRKFNSPGKYSIKSTLDTFSLKKTYTILNGKLVIYN